MKSKIEVEMNICDICQKPDWASYRCWSCNRYFCDVCKKVYLKDEFETLTCRPEDIKMHNAPRISIAICSDCFKEPPKDIEKMTKWMIYIKKIQNRLRTAEKRFYKLYDKVKNKYR